MIQIFLGSYASRARGDDNPRIVLISQGDSVLEAVDVGPILVDQLSPVDVTVDVPDTEVPVDDDGWRKLARQESRRVAGTLAVIGWNCEENRKCELTIVETVDFGIVKIQTVLSEEALGGDQAGSRGDEELGDTDGSGSSNIDRAMAAVIREAIVGGVLGEVSRLAWEGRHPSAPPPGEPRIPKPTEDPTDMGGLARAKRPVFWLELGYTGEFPYPSDGPINGACATAAFSPGKNVVPAISVGWLGVREETTPVGSVTTHRMPVSLQLRISIPVGPALFSVAPVGRLDTVFYKVDPATGSTERGADVEIHVGGVTFWHFPMPAGVVELTIGAGMLATIFADDYSISGTKVVAESKLRVLWYAGVAFSSIID